MGLWACFDTVFNYFNFQILHFTMVKDIKLKGSQQLNISKKVSLLTSAALMTEVAPWRHCQCCDIRLVLSDFSWFFFFFIHFFFEFFFLNLLAHHLEHRHAPQVARAPLLFADAWVMMLANRLYTSRLGIFIL